LKYDLSRLANVRGIIIRWNFFFHRLFLQGLVMYQKHL
jgi:hypothetical protein